MLTQVGKVSEPLQRVSTYGVLTEKIMIHTIEEGPCVFHLAHLSVRWAARGSYLLKNFLSQALLDIRMLG